MAHFAELSSDNIVLRVIVVDNEDILDADGNESEEVGIAFCKSLYGADTNWKQTSYNATFRTHFAGKQFIYDPARDAFIPRRPFLSWVLNPNTLIWEPPVPFPENYSFMEPSHVWDESTRTWVEVTE